MNQTIKEILFKIEKNGFEAYVIGGYVRDFLLGENSVDVDICTNALPKDLKLIFPNGKVDDAQYGSFKIMTLKYNFDITTYRQEFYYHNRRPTKIKYINNLLTDIKRRDFTMNSICMNDKGEVIDLLKAKTDIEQKIIRVIGDIEKKFTDDPLRMLRAIRFSVILDFNIEKKAFDFIKRNKKIISGLSYQRKKEEIERILASPNVVKGLKMLKYYHFDKSLEISYHNIVVVNDLIGMWSQIDFCPKYVFSKNEFNNIKKIKEILKYGKINNIILYKYDLYLCLVAGSIMKMDKEIINKIYSQLPIKRDKDIEITSKEILSILQIEPSTILKNVYRELTKQILKGRLKNENKEIIKYISNNKRRCLNESKW